MKLNNLSRLTALLLALMMLPLAAFASSGTSTGDLTGTMLANMNNAALMIEEGYCETCANDVASAGLTAWPVTGYTCLYEHLADLSPSAAYDMLIAYYTSGDAGSAEDLALYEAYINSHNDHCYNAPADYPTIICDCGYVVLQPGNGEHDTSCPWADEEYVASTTVTDKNGTGITVTGAIPEGVELVVNTTQPVESILSSMIHYSKYADSPTVLAYDIKLMYDGNAWQLDQSVTVTVPKVLTNMPANPLAEVFHLTGAPENVAPGVGFEALTGTMNANGDVSFTTGGFSVFYVVVGESSGDSPYDTTIRELPGEASTYHVEPGTIIQFSSGTITGNGGNGITRSNRTITVSLDAEIGATASFTVDANRDYTLTFVVEDRDDIVTGAITSYPIYLAIKLADKNANGNVLAQVTIPGEPAKSDGDYKRLNSNYQVNTGWAWEEYTFANSAKNYIKDTIGNGLLISIDGSSTAGVYDATGKVCMDYLTNINWNQMMQVAIAQRAYTTDGKRLGDDGVNSDDYMVIPYVIKLMVEKGLGWHIDCAVVPKDNITISYDANLKDYTVTNNTPDVPSAETKTDKFTHTVQDMGGLPSNKTVTATLEGKQYEITFLGWSTDPNATTATYVAGSTIDVEKNTVLYAVWSGKKQVTTLSITKTLVGVDATLAGEFVFNVVGTDEFTTGYSNKVKLSAGATTTLTNLEPGAYIITEDRVEITNYELVSVQSQIGTEPATTLTEPYSCNVTLANEQITSVTYTNTYAPLTANLTITKEGLQPGEYAIVEVTLGDGTPIQLVFTTNGYKIIKDVPIGTKYSVVETAWSWRYEPDYTNCEGEIVAGGNTATITNQRSNTQWLNSECHAENEFNAK